MQKVLNRKCGPTPRQHHWQPENVFFFVCVCVEEHSGPYPSLQILICTLRTSPFLVRWAHPWLQCRGTIQFIILLLWIEEALFNWNNNKKKKFTRLLSRVAMPAVTFMAKILRYFYRWLWISRGQMSPPLFSSPETRADRPSRGICFLSVHWHSAYLQWMKALRADERNDSCLLSLSYSERSS